MGGGAIHFGLEVGPVSAWLDIVFDVFVQFEPFHYMADLSVSVGCAITIKVWFVHVRISVSVGAGLHIEGPDPFGGVSIVHGQVCGHQLTIIVRQHRFLPVFIHDPLWWQATPSTSTHSRPILRNGAHSRT